MQVGHGVLEGDVFSRDRWSDDRSACSAHGVNRTGSFSRDVGVKDGIIAWEKQKTDDPSVGPSRPEYEPRGGPCGAVFSWCTSSPSRARYPYARGVPVQSYRKAREGLGDPVLVWEENTTGPDQRRRYQRARQPCEPGRLWTSPGLFPSRRGGATDDGGDRGEAPGPR